jgi:hypothetical protein
MNERSFVLQFFLAVVVQVLAEKPCKVIKSYYRIVLQQESGVLLGTVALLHILEVCRSILEIWVFFLQGVRQTVEDMSEYAVKFH